MGVSGFGRNAPDERERKNPRNTEVCLWDAQRIGVELKGLKPIRAFFNAQLEKRAHAHVASQKPLPTLRKSALRAYGYTRSNTTQLRWLIE